MSIPDQADSATMERVEPSNIGAEMSALGAMLQTRDAIIAVSAALKAEQYYKPSHETIHTVIVDMFGRGEVVSPLTVARELERHEELARVGGAVYLHECIQANPSTAFAETDALLVAEAATLRKIVRTGQTLTHLGYTGKGDIDDVRNEAANQLQELIDSTKGVEEAQEEFSGAEMMDAVEASWAEPEGGKLPLPWEDLADAVGMMPGNLVIIGARPAVGKSNILLNIAAHLTLVEQLPVLFYSLEMNRLECGQRLLAAEAGVQLDEIKAGIFKKKESSAAVVAAQARIRQAPLTISERTAVPAAHMRLKLRELESDGRLPKAMVVDYLQIMGTGSQTNQNRATEVDAMTKELKNIAKDFGIVVIAAAALNRGMANRTDKKPTMTDLRESGGIEAHANIIILLDRPEQREEGSLRSGEIDLIVEKNRQGKTTTVELAWQGRYCRAKKMGQG